MTEHAIKHLIRSAILHTRPQCFRNGKPLRYPQRNHATVVSPHSVPIEPLQLPWTPPSVAGAAPSPAVSKPRLQELRAESKPRTFSSFLTDNYSREHNYLRISVTERCNLRCVYCMPEEGVQLSPSAHLLTTPEIVYLSTVFVDQGVNKIRLTGGEPTVRKDIVELMRQIGDLRKNGLKELCLTTNGISLHRKLDAMVESGLTGVNLSLDTLDPYQFTIMTRRNGHDAVMKSMNRILEMNKMGAHIKLKINCVVMRGINEREILPFVDLTRDNNLEVRFIEYMPFDGNKWSKGKMLGFQEMLALIRQKYADTYRVQDQPNDTSKTYQIPGFRGRIGFITSMTENFCGTCNRLRITSDGNLKVCLFGNAEVSLRDIVRESNDGRPLDAEAWEAMKQLEMDRHETLPDNIRPLGSSPREARLLEVIGAAVKRKREKHAGMGELENMKNRPMILIDEAQATSKSLIHEVVQDCLHSIAPVSTPRTFTYCRIPLHLLPVPMRQSLRPSLSQLRHASKLANHSSCKASNTRGLDDEGLAALCQAPSQPTLSHLNSRGEAHMVSIVDKSPTYRSASATSTLVFSSASTYATLISASLKKGDVLACSRIAGIQAAKKTSDLIPLAHPGLGITGVNVDITLDPPTSEKSSQQFTQSHTHGAVHITATVSCFAPTGVEMEALTAVTVAGLTFYDMCKAIDKGMVITNTRVISKTGGKSGDWNYDKTSDSIVHTASSKSAPSSTSRSDPKS